MVGQRRIREVFASALKAHISVCTINSSKGARFSFAENKKTPGSGAMGRAENFALGPSVTTTFIAV